MGCACNPSNAARVLCRMDDNIVGAQDLLFSSCLRGILVSECPEFWFQGSALAVRSWLEVVKPGEKEEDEEEGGPDAC